MGVFTFKPFLLYSQNINNITFIVSDLTNTDNPNERIDRDLRIQKTGFSIKLVYEESSQALSLDFGSSSMPFSDFAELLKSAIVNNPEKLIPIFINYNGPSGILHNSFSESGLSKYVYFLPVGEKWPSIDDIKKQEKSIIVFTFQKTREGNSFFHYAWDYIAEFPSSGIEDPLFDGFYPNGNISKELLMIRDLQLPEDIGIKKRFNLDLNQNQYYINYLLNRWKHTGKRPNFIFTKNGARINSLINNWFITYKSIDGIVKINERPFEKVYWKHSNRCITNGTFSFPYMEGEELNLVPFIPGYSFEPQSYTINNENAINNISFEATPLKMEEGLQAYFPFEKSYVNFMDEEDIGTSVGGEFTTDIERGEVVKLQDTAYLKINTPIRYEIKSNSFTVSSWVKLTENEKVDDYSILGSHENVFRKGLHLVVRGKRPYFGFYGNDLWASKIIDPMKWYHIVYRYNYFNGEQAIFVNGENVGFSFNHPSYIGDSILIIGNSISQNNYLNGYIDDLYIWNRPLGNNEIQALYNSEFIPEVEKVKAVKPKWDYLYLLFLPFILFLLAFYKRKKSTQTPDSTKIKKAEKNALNLFGDFQLLNSNGEDVSEAFTPKIKELFLLIVLFTLKTKKGIKTEKLTNEIWLGFEPQKAANNRSVTFNKLRKIIESVEGLDVHYNNGYWKAIFEEPLVCDYKEAQAILDKRHKLTIQDMQLFFLYVKRGVFLYEIHWEWLDELRGYVTNEIIDNLFYFISLLNPKHDSTLIKELAERILAIDNINEKGNQLLLKCLIDNNNLNLAKFHFNQFIHNYLEIFGEQYPSTFDEFLKKEF